MTARLIIIALLLNFSGHAQTTRTDSLRLRLYHATGEERLGILLALGKEQYSLNRDSAYQYAAEAVALAAKASLREKSLASLYFSQSYIPWGWIDSAMAVLAPALRDNKLTDPDQRDIYFLLQRQQAMLYGFSTRYKEALTILYRLVDEARQYSATVAVSANMNSIGSIALARNEPAEAMRWLYSALNFSVTGDSYIPVRCAVYINLGNASLQLNRPDSAAFYLQKAVPLAETAQDLYLLATAYRVQTSVFIRMERLQDAERAFRALQAIKAKTDLSNVSDDNVAIADFYINTNQLQKAIKLCRELIAGSSISATGEERVRKLQIRMQFYEVLARAAQKAGNDTLYAQTLEDIISIKDSVFAASSANEIADIRARYETQLKENTIIQQQALDLTRKNYLFYSVLGVLILAVMLAVYTFYESGKRQKMRMAVAINEEKKLSEDAVRLAEENERIRIAADLHDNLGVYAASLSSNVNYIAAHNKTDLERNALMELKNNSSSIIAELNDTIWALKKESLHLTAISDRVKIFMARFRRSYPHISMEVSEAITTDILFSPSQAFHLYRVVQEAFNNALKHSGAGVIEIRFSSGDSWSVEVADDGTGMDDKLKDAGNGLAGMKKRCADNQWQISWSSGETSGTIVRIGATAN